MARETAPAARPVRRHVLLAPREDQREARVRRRGSDHETYEHVTFLIDHGSERKRWWGLERKRQLARDLRGDGAPAAG